MSRTRIVVAAVVAIWLAALMVALLPRTALATPAKCSAYVFAGSEQSLCGRFPGSEDQNCDDVYFRVTLKNPDYDPWGLDGNGSDKGDGVGCEGNPIKPRPTSSAGTTPSATPSATRKPTTRPSATRPAPSRPVRTTSAAAAPTLPKTGPGFGIVASVALGLLGGGGLLALATRRRRMRFEG